MMTTNTLLVQIKLQYRSFPSNYHINATNWKALREYANVISIVAIYIGFGVSLVI